MNIMKQLGDQAKLPWFLMQSDNLPHVYPLLRAVSVGVQNGMSSQLEALETAQRQNMEEVRKMMVDTARPLFLLSPLGLSQWQV